MPFLFFIFFSFNFILILTIGKVRAPLAAIGSFFRCLISFLFTPYIFPVSDQSYRYFPYILSRSCSNSFQIFDFNFFAHSLHCVLGINNIQVINLFYCTLGTAVFAYIYKQLLQIQTLPPWLVINNNIASLFSRINPREMLYCLLFLTPSMLTYTTTYGKDIYSCLFLYMLIR